MAKISVEQVEATYGITSREVRNAIADGHLAGERVHGKWVVDSQSLHKAIEAGVLKDRKNAMQS
jgi:hypothetical protein